MASAPTLDLTTSLRSGFWSTDGRQSATESCKGRRAGRTFGPTIFNGGGGGGGTPPPPPRQWGRVGKRGPGNGPPPLIRLLHTSPEGPRGRLHREPQAHKKRQSTAGSVAFRHRSPQTVDRRHLSGDSGRFDRQSGRIGSGHFVFTNCWVPEPPPPPPPPKGPSWETTKFAVGNFWLGHCWYTHFWVPNPRFPPHPPPSTASLLGALALRCVCEAV